jgi:dipeptidyl aminopeptidase/acylaminoacyl peptidase
MDRILAVAALLASPFVAAQSLIPLEHFAASPQFSEPSMSPDGSRVVYIGWANNIPYIVLYDVETRTPKALGSGASDGFTVSRCDFKTRDRLVCRFRGVDHDAGRPFWTSRMIAVNADGTKMRTLVQNKFATAAQFQDRILHWLPDNPRRVLIQLDDNENIYPSVYTLDVFDGKMTLVDRERAPIQSWMTDRTGAVRFGYGWRELSSTGEFVARAADGAPWRVLHKFKRFETLPFGAMGFGVRPNILLVSAPHNGRDAIWEMDLDETNDMQLLYANPEVDVDRAIVWPADGRVVGFQYSTDKTHSRYFDPEAQRIDAALKQFLADTSNHIIHGSRDGKRFIIQSYSDVKPSRYYLLDIGASKLFAMGSEKPQFEDAALAPMKPIIVKTPDGLSIPGYLTLPAGKDPKNLPAVVYPHGGPHVRDYWGYDEVVQMMASRGYAVLQINFRGSSGYGDDWGKAGWRGWGTVMHDDITAGARWLISEGIANPKRMCIVGWSYGGYAALLGVVKEPELYRCAASIAGVSDLTRLSRDFDRFYGGRAAVADILGSDRKELAEVSPLKQADRIKVPVLQVHGDDDVQVLVDHSKNMAQALNRAGIRNELVLIRDGDHALSRADWRLALFTKLDKFLAENLQ